MPRCCLCLKVAGGADGFPTNQQTKPEEETESGNTNATGAHIYYTFPPKSNNFVNFNF